MNADLLSNWLEWLPDLGRGLQTSVLLAAVSLAIGIPIGLLLAVLVSSRRAAIRMPSIVLVEIGRGTPALVVLQLVYFGLPNAGLTLGPFTAASAALALTTAAYTSEIIRGGLEAVPKGEVEASQALGMSYRDTMRFVLIPQGMRIAIPALVGFGILMFQATSLAFTISLQELLSRAYSIGSSTFLYFQVLLLAGVLYLAITLPSGWLTGRLERRLSRHL
ncbi:amino acid ABC transporter membrane protein 2, PAAT family [Quadrisphaera granulorum]|uniref:Amino acid ABC transporter membrane protein 2 (PAAT family) n=1 Tax=Quadrisphaera granulorum TaxID=317664 RepID=A0A316A8M8_9ACTN|nr:amino acid ABC transporter permease [Quadrisphaera granulorum]PWJ53872.1 amino acid ABC transporter membrane protein 2 (PAAT family) [Quadrisphaera granulorum]SZE96629.1 amino acid ABC transporter membrane protein 2, PAAT family [Quadrisphaera granulorum]